ncbi:MAG: hypothetical protein ACXWZM_07600, partial [Solirubrobacterales bacterium]
MPAWTESFKADEALLAEYEAMRSGVSPTTFDPKASAVRRLCFEWFFASDYDYGAGAGQIEDGVPVRVVYAEQCWPADDAVWGLAAPGVAVDGDVLRLVRYEVMAAAYRLDFDYGLAGVFERRATAIRAWLRRKTGKCYRVVVTEGDLPTNSVHLYWADSLKVEGDTLGAILAEQLAAQERRVGRATEADQFEQEACHRRKWARDRHDNCVTPLFRELYSFPPRERRAARHRITRPR